MSDFFVAFFDVVFYPVNPEFLVFEDNPLILSLSMFLVGISLIYLFRRCLYGLFGVR